MTALLEAVDVEKSYGSIRALHPISFSVAEGEIFGLLGPNGAGKTTLLSIVSGLLDAGAGDFRLDGRSLLSSDGSLKSKIGIVPQELAVYGELTARENLHFFGELYGLHGRNLSASVKDVLAAIGLEDRADDAAKTYSGGMKRRLNLGAALVHRPKLLLLDEPTVGVDPQSRNHIFEEVRRLNAAGMTIVYTSHYMEEVQALCSRVGIIDHGRLIACDTLPGLLGLLHGEIRVRLRRGGEDVLTRQASLPDTVVTDAGERGLLIRCRDVKTTLIGLMSLLNELRIELLELEIEEPNLERVFLHLTHKALRD